MGQLPAHRYRTKLLLLLVLFQSCPPASPSDVPEATYRSQVAEVRVIFSATDRNDHAVANLKPGDFAVVDKEDIVRSFQSFTRAEFTQLNISILIDTSASMTPHYREEIAEVIDLLSKTSGVPEGDVSVVSFRGLKATSLCRENCRSSHAIEQLPDSRSAGLTPLYDALISAAESMPAQKDPQARRVLILFSDGYDTISKNAASDAIAASLANDVEVYAICPGRSPASFLQDLSSATGGRVFLLREGAETVSDAVLSDFRASYQITYKLPFHAAGFHPIRILPTHDLNLRFRCRRGYYYPAGR